MAEEKTVTDIVRDVLDKKPKAEEDNMTLLYYVWKAQGAKLPPLKEFKGLANPASVMRSKYVRHTSDW